MGQKEEKEREREREREREKGRVDNHSQLIFSGQIIISFSHVIIFTNNNNNKSDTKFNVVYKNVKKLL